MKEKARDKKSNKVKIGVKFCGGCQSKYDRGNLYKKIKEDFKNICYDYVSEDEVYDYLLVISGCHIKCAGIKNYKYKKIINIDNYNYKDFHEVITNELVNNSIINLNEKSSNNS